jgi:hypothetical protein
MNVGSDGPAPAIATAADPQGIGPVDDPAGRDPLRQTGAIKPQQPSVSTCSPMPALSFGLHQMRERKAVVSE